MPSQMINRIANDCGMDTNRIEQWYDAGRERVDARGWSPNEGRYWAYINRFAQRRAMDMGIRKASGGEDGPRHSRALQALLKATLSEIEAERQGIHL